MWTRLTQGFKNSPALFNDALADDLSKYQRVHPDLTVLQYVDDLLLTAPSEESCLYGSPLHAG